MAGKNKRKRNNKKNALKNNDITEKEDVGHGEEVDESVGNDQIQRLDKRKHEEDNSDTEDKPIRKKKKKLPVPGDTAENKGKKSIRQAKREKHAQRLAEREAASKDQLASQCITYLSQWKHDKQNWKFMKVKQVWLYKNKFSSKLIPDSSWKTLLEYFESAQGNIRNLLLEDANKVIKQLDEWTESQKDQQEITKDDEENKEAEDEKKPEITKPDDVTYKRARDILQCLN